MSQAPTEPAVISTRPSKQPTFPLDGWLPEPRQAVLWIILASTLLHLGLALYLPLASHEAHYASYGFRLDYGYVDHPPLVGWLQALPVHLLGGGDLAVRLLPLLLTALSLYMLAALTRELYPDDSPWLPAVALLLLQGNLVVHAGFTMAPEVPFLTLSIAALWFTHRIVVNDSWADWVALGCVLGLAGLAKFSAIAVAVSVPLALVVSGKWRLLLSPRFWAAVGIALVIVSPAVVWNQQHGWVSFVHQLDYQVKSQSTWQVERAAISQLFQFAAYSPLLYIAGIVGAVAAVRGSNLSDRLILAFALPVLIVFFIAGGYTRGRIHWTFVGWTLLAPLAAHWLIINWKHRAARILTVSSGVFSLLAMIVVVGLTAPAWRFPDHAHPYGELYGWREATARGVQLLTDLRRQPGTEQAEFFVLDFHDAEKLAWYARPLPAVVISPKTSQYPIWFGDAAPGDPGILVIPEYKSGGPDQPPAAYGCAFFEEYVHYHGETLTASFHYYRCGV